MFQSESTLCSCVHSSVWASLAKWMSVRLWTKWFWVRVQLQSLILNEWFPNNSLICSVCKCLFKVNNAYLLFRMVWWFCMILHDFACLFVHPFAIYLFLVVLLTYFMPLVSFCAPRKHQLFLFSEGAERAQWHEMG